MSILINRSQLKHLTAQTLAVAFLSLSLPLSASAQQLEPALKPATTTAPAAAPVKSASIPQQAEPLSGRLIYQTDRYLLGAGDVLSLQVALEPDYSQNEILIGPDGRASIIGIGDVDMKDRSIEDVSAEITTRLKRIIKSPHVALSLRRTKPAIVYLSGAVMHSGMFQQITSSTTEGSAGASSGKDFQSRTDMRLSNILANTGGVMPTADLSQVQVKRSNTNEVITVDLWKMLKEGAQNQDVVLNSGDSVFIPHNDKMALSDEEYNLLLGSSIGPKTFAVRVLGEVDKPGVYELDSTSPFLNSAIAKAGGLQGDANRKLVAVRRFTSETSFNTFYVQENKLDIVLRPNDVVYIPESKLHGAGRIGFQVSQILAPFQTVGMAAAFSSQVFAFGGWKRVR